MEFIALDMAFHALNSDHSICWTTAKLWYWSILTVGSDGIFYRLWNISQSGDYIWQYEYTAIRICTTKELRRSELAVVYCLCSLTITLTSPLHTLVLEWRWISSTFFPRRCKWLLYLHTFRHILCAVKVTGKLVFKSWRGSSLTEDGVENLREYSGS